MLQVPSDYKTVIRPSIVFGGMAGSPSAGMPPFLFYLTNLLGWIFSAGHMPLAGCRQTACSIARTRS